jgi:hypothetical protein
MNRHDPSIERNGMALLARLRYRAAHLILDGRLNNDRGDVPGWVLVAVMTAGLVTAIWILADHQLTSVFNRAISAIAGP